MFKIGLNGFLAVLLLGSFVSTGHAWNTDYYEEAIDHPDRPDSDRDKDESRKPELILPFAQIKPGIKVLEIGSGGGHTTELVARVVGDKGIVYAQALSPARVAGNRLPNVIALRRHLIYKLAEVLKEEGVGSNELDVVIIFFAFHDMYLNKRIDKHALLTELKSFLKPGGSLVILDNRAEPGTGLTKTRKLHRIDEKFVRREVEGAGFLFEKSSNVLRNPNDDLELPWQQAGGFHDRFAFRFIKPQDEPTRTK